MEVDEKKSWSSRLSFFRRKKAIFALILTAIVAIVLIGKFHHISRHAFRLPKRILTHIFQPQFSLRPGYFSPILAAATAEATAPRNQATTILTLLLA